MYVYALNGLSPGILFLYASGGVYFLALSAAGRGGGSRVHHGASVSPGRAPWRVIWAFKSLEI